MWAGFHTAQSGGGPGPGGDARGRAVAAARDVRGLPGPCRFASLRLRAETPVQTAGGPSRTLRLENTNEIWKRANTTLRPHPPCPPEKVTRNETKCHPHHLWLVSRGEGQGQLARSHGREPWPRAPGPLRLSLSRPACCPCRRSAVRQSHQPACLAVCLQRQLCWECGRGGLPSREAGARGCQQPPAQPPGRAECHFHVWHVSLIAGVGMLRGA